VGAGAFFALASAKRKKERESAKKKEREKSESEFALFPQPTVGIRFQSPKPLGRGEKQGS
jgi:hypothetical protein